MADNIAQLYNEAQKILDEILEKDISVYTKAILSQHIWNDIYWAYTPKVGGWSSRYANTQGQHDASGTYRRRYGLPRSVYSVLVESGVLMTTSDAKPRPPVKRSKSYPAQPGEFLLLLEGNSSAYNGGMGVWQGGFPRPAVTRAQREINHDMPAIIRKYLKDRIG